MVTFLSFTTGLLGGILAGAIARGALVTLAKYLDSKIHNVHGGTIYEGKIES